ncbi:MAG TPA: hypothetical protein VGS19_30560 [Streptosporangiaceae bacterium]|nr:hypothetical protein [Streptosporangiaceae bacterium]
MDDITSALPEVPAEIREAARRAGGGWLDEVVGGHQPPVPPSAVRGSWRLDTNGEVTGEYIPNPSFGQPKRPRCPYTGKA